MPAVSFIVYGVAQPKGSTRAFMRPGARFPVVTADNPKNKGWQHLVADAASRALQRTPAGTLLEGPVALSVTFYLPRPKSLPKRVHAHAHVKKPDLDKLIRSVKDALSRVVWRDDAQVVGITATKGYAGPQESPRAYIYVSTVTEEGV